jgi:phosphatidylglycerophosphate synthase
MYWVSIKELRARSQKADYGYDVYPLMFRFIRVISIYFTWLLIQTRCKPNTITIIGVIFGVLSGVMFFFGFVGTALILAALAVIADFSDGEVSRFHNTKSKEGTYLDSVHHFVLQPYFIAGIVLWSFETNGSRPFLVAGMVSVINSIILTVVITAAVDNALLKHLMRHIRSSGNVLVHTKIVSSSESQRKKLEFIRTIPGTLARIMDFPYVIIILGAAVALMHYGRDSVFSLNGNLLVYLIYIYAFLSAGLICVFIWNTVHSKHIEKRLKEMVRAL